MTTRRATYLDIPVQQRRSAAKAAKARYQAMLADPTLSKEQKAHLIGLIKQATKWESGTLPTS